MPVPWGPGIEISVDYFGPLPIHAPGYHLHILLFTARFSLHSDTFAVSAAEFTADGTVNGFINGNNPLWGMPA